MSIKLNIFECQNKINSLYPNETLKVLSGESKRKGSYTYEIECKNCGAIYKYTKKDDIFNNKRTFLCKNCGKERISLINFENRLKEKFKNEKLQIINFTKAHSKCDIKCLTCGKIFHFENAMNIFQKANNFCNNCYSQKEKIIEEKRIKFLNFLNNNNCWTLNQDISKLYSKDLVECICTVCGEKNYKTFDDYIRGRGCLKCSGNKKKTTEEFINELDEEYELLDEYKNAYTKVKLRHICGFIYETTPHNYLNGSGCPRCNRHSSKGEKKIEKYLKNKNIKYEKEYSIKINKHKLRIDFFIPDYNLFIEFQGIQHYEPVQFFGGEKRFKKQQYYDNLKRQNINKLLEISYKEINDIDIILDNYFQSSTTISKESKS